MGRGVEAGGVDKSQLYTHIAAGAAYEGSPGMTIFNAPLRAAFNEHSRPGFTTYADMALRDNYNPIYEELAKQGVEKWGGCRDQSAGA